VRRVPGLAHRPGTYSGVEFKVPLFQTRAVGKLFVVPAGASTAGFGLPRPIGHHRLSRAKAGFTAG
jgi:hypothetical protein